MWTSARRWLAALIAAAVLAGCGGPVPQPSIPVAATSGAESQLIAELYVAALRYYGNPAHVQASDDPLQQLDSGAATVAPGFTGQLLARFDPSATVRSDAQVYRKLLSALPEGIAAGDYTISADDKPAIAVTEQTVAGWPERDATTFARRCAGMTVGAVTSAQNPQRVGTCTVSDGPRFAAASTLFDALESGQVQGAWTTSAAPDVPSDVVVLSDKQALIRAENVVPLYRRNELTESQVLALNEIAGVLDTGSLADMRRQVAEGTDPGVVAGRWLDAHPLGVGH
ncbi:glycine betaine ABC transporter substrate-binding protein [Mycobacterium sp. SMC-4]|uniref:glycine betaine ABC transporter substrate-binding protein n=1 Tax=Mycobacterium sp. SMC-4 TaxID=2857059 RepID=UPI0021B26F7C|nr:glycine betaine ABC transporter substrate-binding protein [Mycobacterium sp. SMC-4]